MGGAILGGRGLQNWLRKGLWPNVVEISSTGPRAPSLSPPTHNNNGQGIVGVEVGRQEP